THMKSRGLSGRGNIEGRVVVIQQAVEAGGLLAAHMIDRQVARHREEPCAECVLVVELVPAFEHADPRFLEEVFRQIAAAGQVHEIAEKAMLVLLDQPVEQVGIPGVEVHARSRCFLAPSSSRNSRQSRSYYRYIRG